MRPASMIRRISAAALAFAASALEPAHAGTPGGKIFVCGTLSKGALKIDEWADAKADFKTVIYYIVKSVRNERVIPVADCAALTTIKVKAIALPDDKGILAEWKSFGLDLKGAVRPVTRCENSPLHAGVLGQLMWQAKDDKYLRDRLEQRLYLVAKKRCPEFDKANVYEHIVNLANKKG